MFPPSNTGPSVSNINIEPKIKFKSKSRFLNAMYNFYVYLHNQVVSINNSKYFIGIIIIIMNIAGKFVNFKMSKTVESYLKFSFSRNILIFAMIWMGTRDIYIAILMTLVFIGIVDYLFNEESMFCCLPETFTDNQISKLEEPDVKITPDDINTMKRIIEKMTNQDKVVAEKKDLVANPNETLEITNNINTGEFAPFSSIQPGPMAGY